MHACMRHLAGTLRWSLVSDWQAAVCRPLRRMHAVPIINHQETDVLLRRMDEHLQQYELVRRGGGWPGRSGSRLMMIKEGRPAVPPMHACMHGCMLMVATTS